MRHLSGISSRLFASRTNLGGYHTRSWSIAFSLTALEAKRLAIGTSVSILYGSGPQTTQKARKVIETRFFIAFPDPTESYH